MSYFSEMEWSTKWDWENMVTYGSKAIEIPKRVQYADWMMVDDGEIDTVSFNLSGGGNYSASGSDGFHGSSGKSPVSASTDSSIKGGIQTPNLITGFDGSSLNFRKNIKMKSTEASGTSPLMEASMGSVEPLIGLKLGKRTYFENSCAGGNVKSTPVSVMPTPSAVLQKKTKTSGKTANIPRCQVEGCNLNLSMAKEYHQKHRICDAHSKCPNVTIGGLERRFCQQCSRFHSLSEFDEKKRSCRRRLSDHNARRRKPAQESIQFNSTWISSPFYGSTWDTTCNSKFTFTKNYALKSNYGDTEEQLHLSGVKFPHLTMYDNALLASKTFRPEVLSPGSKGSLISSSHVDAAAPVYHRALSLLSNNSWARSSAPESVPVQHHHHHSMHQKDTPIIQPMMTNNAAIPEGVADGQHLMHQPCLQSLAANSNFQEIQHLETPYEADFYSTVLN